MIKRISSLCSALVLLAFLLTPQHAEANPEALLRQAEKYYEQLEYVAALKVLLAVQQAKGVTAIQRARAYLYMGVCFTALGRAEHAVQAFVEVLKIRNRFRLPPGVSPSIRTMFAEALKRQKLPLVPPPEKATPPGPKPAPVRSQTVDILAKAPLKTSAGKPLAIKIDIEDPSKRIKGLQIRWRRIGGPDYSTVKLVYTGKTATVEGLIPLAAVGQQKGRLTYYVEAQDETGRVVARSGNEDAPYEVELTPLAGKSSNWGWWTLGIVGGAAAIAGGIVAVVLLTKDKGGPVKPAGTAGVIVVVE